MLSSPREPALRKARVCYDHLAGEVGVSVYEALTRQGALTTSEDGLRLTDSGEAWFARMGVNTEAAARQRRIFCRPCMDWSERRFHLAGALGAALLNRFRELGWVKFDKHSRVVRITPSGERELKRFGP
jgi:predicted methyltransferase